MSNEGGVKRSRLERFGEACRRAQPYWVVFWLCTAFMIVLLWPRVFISVKPGEAGVLWLRFFNGTITDRVFEEGFHIICPWDKMTIYNVRIQNKPHAIDVLTKNGLRITLRLSIRYQPQYDMLGVLHQTVGPTYVDKIVVPEVESTLRTVIGNYSGHEVYTTQDAILSKIINKALESTSHRYVRIDSVIIREIVLPEFVRSAIEQKIEQQELANAYVYRIERERREAERRVIEAKGLKDANEIVSSSLNPLLLKWKGVQATKVLATSSNTKVIVIGSGGSDGLPIILGADKP